MKKGRIPDGTLLFIGKKAVQKKGTNPPFSVEEKSPFFSTEIPQELNTLFVDYSLMSRMRRVISCSKSGLVSSFFSTFLMAERMVE